MLLLLLLCVHEHLSMHVYVYKHVIMMWVGLWGNKSALSSWSGTKWLRKQAELWFYSLMFVNNIYNRGLESAGWGGQADLVGLEHREPTRRQKRQTETVQFSSAQINLEKQEKWPKIISSESHKLNNNKFYFPSSFHMYPALNDHTRVAKLFVLFSTGRGGWISLIISAQTQ